MSKESSARIYFWEVRIENVSYKYILIIDLKSLSNKLFTFFKVLCSIPGSVCPTRGRQFCRGQRQPGRLQPLWPEADPDEAGGWCSGGHENGLAAAALLGCRAAANLFGRFSGKSFFKDWSLETGFETKRRCKPGNTKGGSITVPLTSCLTGTD